MTRQEVSARIREIGLVPSIRVSSESDALFAADAITAAGIPIVEITMTVPGAIEVIRILVESNHELIVGAGTLLEVRMAQQCLDAGARFLTGPGFDAELVAFANRNQVAVLTGALTPTEVASAWKAGSDFVKVFPCASVGGASYIRALKAPFPDIPLIAAGGVNQATAPEFILAGAAALGVGTELIPHTAIQSRNESWIRELARRFLGMIAQSRSELPRQSKIELPD